jgi:hypothetical protein
MLTHAHMGWASWARCLAFFFLLLRSRIALQGTEEEHTEEHRLIDCHEYRAACLLHQQSVFNKVVNDD